MEELYTNKVRLREGETYKVRLGQTEPTIEFFLKVRSINPITSTKQPSVDVDIEVEAPKIRRIIGEAKAVFQVEPWSQPAEEE